ncbi:hypothetical protein ABH917_003302 [Thermobifida halotolerans]
MTRQPNPARIQKVRKMSTMAIRLRVKCSPSTAMMTPADAPSSTERVIRSAMRTSSSTDSAPNSAAAIRHPVGVMLSPNDSRPHRVSPRAISHLPNGGCTTKSPPPLKISDAPWFSNSSALSTVSCS